MCIAAPPVTGCGRVHRGQEQGNFVALPEGALSVSGCQRGHSGRASVLAPARRPCVRAAPRRVRPERACVRRERAGGAPGVLRRGAVVVGRFRCLLAGVVVLEAAEAAVALAIVINIYNNFNSINVDEASALKE